jgi:hypothetical protein
MCNKFIANLDDEWMGSNELQRCWKSLVAVSWAALQSRAAVPPLVENALVAMRLD